MRLVFAMWLACACPAWAATNYILSTATGTQTGADWTNARTNLPSSLVRGDTYYIGDGTYPAYTFDDAASGATLITIKRATTNDHGTSVGWSDAFADGVAEWVGGWSITTANWVFDGSTGGGPGSWETGFGFKIAPGVNDIITIPFGATATNITLRHIEGTCGTPYGPPYATGLYLVNGATGGNGITIEYCYFHDVPGDMMQTRSLQNFTVQYTKLARWWQDSGRHGDGIENDGASTNYLVRYCWIEDGLGTYIFGHHNAGDFDTFGIIGNLFTWTSSFTNQCDNGAISSLQSGTGKLLNLRVFNNTFWNLNNGRIGNISINPYVGGSTAFVSNNIFGFKSGDTNTSTFIYSTNVSHGNNWFFNRSVSETGADNSSGDPFVDSAGNNFQLLTNGINGVTIGSPYTADMLGTNFNVSGTWTPGALAFSGAPAAPAGSTVTTTSTQGGARPR